MIILILEKKAFEFLFNKKFLAKNQNNKTIKMLYSSYLLIEYDLNNFYLFFEIERRPIMLWSIIIGGLIGLVAGGVTKKGGSMGVIANVLAGLIGSSVGQSLLGSWGPSLAGMALLPSIAGAVIVVSVVSCLLGKKK